MNDDVSGLTAACLAATGGAPQALIALEIEDRGAWLGGPLAVDGLSVGAVAAALFAGAELAEARTNHLPALELSAEHAALSFRSERHAKLKGAPLGAGFAPLSRIVRCADGGWARTHGNYTHHAAALGRALGFSHAQPPHEAVAALEAAAARIGATELEDAVVAAGGCAAALRSPEAWAEHPAGREAARAPLIHWREDLAARPDPLLPSSAGEARPAEARPASGLRVRPASGPRVRPASGLRVLDLTRVIAGPVAGRTLAALGAEVLRVDPPMLAELPEQHLDTGPGKRSAVLNLAAGERREALLAGADVLLVGYRPGSLAPFGMTAAAVVERHPHLVQVWLSAWGASGPWGSRRGFDSLVQVASGIAATCADPDGVPGVLPAQALDHATGHLMAAAALAALARRTRGEGFAPAELSLAATAAALLSAPRPDSPSTKATGAADPERYRAVFGDVALIAPPGSLDGVPLRWAHGPRPLGGDLPLWNA